MNMPIAPAPRRADAATEAARSGSTWLARRTRAIVHDFAPAVLAVTGIIVLGILIEVLGGPRVRPPGGPEFAKPASRTMAWTLLVGLSGLLVERGVALHRRIRNGATLLPARRAATRFLFRRTFRAFSAGLFLGLVSFLLPFFLGFKRAIPRVQEFGPWDIRLAGLDRALHLGTDPWRILHPLLGTPVVTAFLDDLYYLWFPFCVLGAAALAWLLPRERRVRFYLGFVAVWIVLGILVATTFASGGPVYFSRIVGGPDPYRDLMAYLASVDLQYPLQAVLIQERLWEAYAGGFTGVTSGIAALPSLHVAIPVLYALAFGKRYPRTALVVWAYAALVFLGSIHLGWHYAVDGYASLVLVLLVWKGAGAASGAWERRRVERARRPEPPAKRVGPETQPPA